ncbi:tRNA nucleotidyltransferase/polyA polymerase family protein [Perilla frutescens var. hirtella]|uniref:tRNA nucleotidyltransferase/polyA polymerase family protein n=1 Tax=Perilla frutescens var. hirtella TaxID=608512 RepID=A0AAD4IT81_PERFH|nr:tRNA nucleotidyltransferase/polyA polymerase family protein [Perilla frutescens var. hirtella]
MAISTGLGFYRLPSLSLRSPLRHCSLQVSQAYAASVEAFDDIENDKSFDSLGGRNACPKALDWKKLKSEDLGISTSKISRPTRVVLNGLRKRGFEVYLVGGCVRDLILRRVPKDFDVITSAELKDVMRTFSRCEMVGRRFPICHVHIDDTLVEVSSFSTRATRFGRFLSLDPEKPADCDEKDYVRWRNCLQRDFTINGLMFDPYAKLVYDYTGGVNDILKAKVRTIKPANLSLTEDCARILRAVRIAARLDFRFSKETALAVRRLSATILRLDRGRLLMEVNYMLAYGSAEASLRLLWKLGLLEILLPIQAAYFVRNGFRRRDRRYNMLLSLFSNLDKHVAPDRPCHNSLWFAILAFHEALSGQPRDPRVVAAFSLAVHNGGDLSEALNIARRINKQHEISFDELLEPEHMESNELLEEVTNLAASVRSALHHMTDEYFISQAMAKYPKAPYSDLVFLPVGLYLRVCKIFECVGGGREKGFVPKHGSKINYELLAMGSLKEIRHAFARVVFDTVYPINSR